MNDDGDDEEIECECFMATDGTWYISEVWWEEGTGMWHHQPDPNCGFFPTPEQAWAAHFRMKQKEKTYAGYRW